MNTRNTALIPVGIAALALLLTGCVTNSDSGSKTGGASSSAPISVAKDDALAAKVPDAIKTAGVFNVGIDPEYAPNEYKDSSGAIVGWEVDFFDAVAAKLGLKAKYNESKFDNIIPSVSQGGYDVGLSSFTDNTAREETVDFVNYYSAGILWAAPSGKTVDPGNACGLKVAVQATTYQDTDELPEKSKACTDAGKSAIQVLKFDTQDQATNAVVIGQADAFSADSPVSEYAVGKAAGKLQKAGETFDTAPYGLAVKKDSAVGPVFREAVQALIDDGTYGKILSQWGLDGGTIAKADLNAAGKK